ncbi:MAG: SMC-Scp complex subunit ScpB [Phycisphaerales bacterium]|nr:SMC-Scp complex subunit ScpB [Phycisphaerales bacterium]
MATSPQDASASPNAAVAVDQTGMLSEVDFPGLPCADASLQTRIEALLFAADRPIAEGRIVELLGLPEQGKPATQVRHAIERLNEAYTAGGRAFRIEQVAGGRQVLTLPAFAPVVSRLRGEKQQTRLTQAAIETIAIIAYRQPIQRAEIEVIRGVACGEVLRGLLERRLARIVGRAEELGRPMLYGTTGEFLKVFGLASLTDLPQTKGQRG